MAHKKIMPNIKLAAGASVGASVLSKVDANGVTKVVLAHRTFREAYPSNMPADNFSLQKQIEAGVQLKEVNSEVLSDDVNFVPLSEKPIVEPDNEFEE